MVLRQLTVLLGLSALAASSYALVPPWYYDSLVLQNTIGKGPCVRVGDPDLVTNIIPVTACSDDVGKALLFIMGNTKQVKVINPQGQEIAPFTYSQIPQTIDFVAQQLDIAFKDNPLFVQVHLLGIFKGTKISLEVQPKIIQFQTDNIEDPFRHSTFLAQDLFAKVLNAKYFDKIEFLMTSSPLN